MKNPKRTKQLAIASLAAIGVIGVSSIAYAVFSEQSTANATGTAAEMAPLVVGTGDDAPEIDFAGNETQLWPNVGNAHLATAKVKVTNTNEVTVRVTEADIIGAVQFNPGTPAACVGKIHVTTPIEMAGDTIDLATDETKELELTGIYLDEDAPNVCQNQPFTTTWTVKANAL